MSSFTINDFTQAKLKQRKITMVTAYDYWSAQLLAAAGVDTILVGDSLGMVVQGLPNTLHVSVDDMVYHSKAVRRGAPAAFIVADLPYLSYHISKKETLRNAGRLISEAQADAVKLELNHPHALKQLEVLARAQINVIAHVGMTPQSVNLWGGFKVQGKQEAEAERILELAQSAQAAGAAAIVVECVPATLAARITESVGIATIGIGAGAACDGQVLVFHDLLGISERLPKFVKPYTDSRQQLQTALQQFVSEVQQQQFPSAQYSFK